MHLRSANSCLNAPSPSTSLICFKPCQIHSCLGNSRKLLFIRMVSSSVLPQSISPSKLFSTVVAFVRLFSGSMRHLVHGEVAVSCKRFPTLKAQMWSFTCVSSFVSDKRYILRKLFLTSITSVWLLSRVDQLMSVKMNLGEEPLSTFRTSKLPLSIVKYFVFPQITSTRKGLLAVVTNKPSFKNILMVNLSKLSPHTTTQSKILLKMLLIYLLLGRICHYSRFKTCS